MAKPFEYTKDNLILITGASQGIGRTLAIELARRSRSSTIVLIARSQGGLEQTKLLMAEVNRKCIVKIAALDLTRPQNTVIQALIDDANAGKTFESAIIFHNVGQIGTLSPVSELINSEKWHNYYDLNVFSVAVLNSIFLKLPIRPIFVINITSLAARKPFKNMGMYGSGKAARELLFKVLAEEEKDVVVLNYSPGPVDTNMITEVIENVKDDDVREAFTTMIQNKTILKPTETVDKLLSILEIGNYRSGDVIDYYDRK